MRKILLPVTFILTIGLVFVIITAQKLPDKKKFYYAFNEKKFLDEIPDKFVVKFKNKDKANKLSSVLKAEIGNEKKIEYKNETTITIDLKNNVKNINEFLTGKMTDIELIKPAYKYEEQPMYYTNEILVEPLDKITIGEVIKRNGLDAFVKIREGKFYSVIEIASAYDACEVANKIQESGLVKYSHPNFIIPMVLNEVIPNDTYFNNQFYLRNWGQVFNPVENHAGTPGADINASWAWTLTTGNNNIIVAVIDEGVTPDHPDLPNTRQVRLNGSNFVPGENSNDPSPGLHNNHGNATAGIIAATQNNNEGVSGVAPNIRIMPIKAFGQNGNADNNGLAAAIDFAWQNGADVISNGWGYYKIGDPNYIPAIVAAINRAVTQGRGNRGCVVVFAAGNNATHYYNGYIGIVEFPSSVKINGVLTVGASDRDDKQADYSPTSNITPGADVVYYNQIIDVVAPSHKAFPEILKGIPGETREVWTIDIPGSNGYNPWNIADFSTLLDEILPASGTNNLSYTGRMGGTSASAPQVAAVAALMLSVNPNLTQLQVFNILTQNADRVGGYTYTNGWSLELGNGRVNACAAVANAFPLSTISGPDTVCYPGSVYSIPSAGVSTYSWSIDNPNLATIIANGNSATISQNGSSLGNLTVKVVITRNCGRNTISNTVTRTIWVGQRIPIVQGWYNSPTNPAEPMYPSGRFEYNWNDACYTQYINTNMQFSSGATVIWENAGSSAGVSWWQDGNNISFYFSDLDQYAYFRVRATSFCGTTTVLYRFRSVACSGGGIMMLSVNPNPSNSDTKVSLTEKGNPDNKKDIRQIKIIDKTGLVKKQYHYGAGIKTPIVNTSGLSPDIYTIIAFDGKRWTATKLMVQ